MQTESDERTTYSLVLIVFFVLLILTVLTAFEWAGIHIFGVDFSAYIFEQLGADLAPDFSTSSFD